MTYFIWYLTLWQKIDHVYQAEVEVKTVILEACADVVMATTSYAHLQQEIVLFPINNLKETVNFVIIKQIITYSPLFPICLPPSPRRPRPGWSPALGSPSGRGCDMRRCSRVGTVRIPACLCLRNSVIFLVFRLFLVLLLASHAFFHQNFHQYRGLVAVVARFCH